MLVFVDCFPTFFDVVSRIDFMICVNSIVSIVKHLIVVLLDVMVCLNGYGFVRRTYWFADLLLGILRLLICLGLLILVVILGVVTLGCVGCLA